MNAIPLVHPSGGISILACFHILDSVFYKESYSSSTIVSTLLHVHPQISLDKVARLLLHVT
jgi:hypothetical protein